jgi:hypothetical protein
MTITPEDIYQAVCRAIRDTLMIQAQPPSSTPPEPHPNWSTDAERVLWVLSRVGKYQTGEFPPELFQAGWMPHSKLLRLSAMDSKRFRVLMARLIMSGAVVPAGREIARSLGVNARMKLYALAQSASAQSDAYTPTAKKCENEENA